MPTASTPWFSSSSSLCLLRYCRLFFAIFAIRHDRSINWGSINFHRGLIEFLQKHHRKIINIAYRIIYERTEYFLQNPFPRFWGHQTWYSIKKCSKRLSSWRGHFPVHDLPDILRYKIYFMISSSVWDCSPDLGRDIFSPL